MTGRITWTSSGEAHSGQPGGYLVQKALHVERIASGTKSIRPGSATSVIATSTSAQPER